MSRRASDRTGRTSVSIVLGLAVAFLLGGLCAYGLYPTVHEFISRFTPGAGSTGPTAPPPARSGVSALGRLQPSGGVIAVYGLPGDHIQELKVQQGTAVRKDQVLAVLASQKDRREEYRLAEIQLEEAKEQHAAIRKAAASRLAEIELEIRHLEASQADDLRVQEAKLGVLEAQVRQAHKQLERVESLTLGRVAEQDVQQQRLALTTAEGELAAARAVLDKTRNTYRRSHALALAKRTSAEAERDQALRRLPLDSLEQSVKLAKRRLDRTEVLAPVAGTVLKVVGHEGDATGGQPLLHLAAGGGMLAVAEVYETDVGLLHEWLEKHSRIEVEVTSRALRIAAQDGKLKGHVKSKEQIARMIAQNSLFSLNPREELDRRVIEVQVELDAESAAKAAEFVGLQVEVRFQQPP